MKEIKWMLYTLYVAGYTSLIWASIMWKGIAVGPQNAPLGYIFGGLWTLINLLFVIVYIQEHWKDDKND